MTDDEAIEILFPACGYGKIVALRAYMDASIRSEEIISVSGFAFGLDNAKKANREWKKLFGDKICHMTDLHNRRGEFSDITREQGGELLKGAVRIINRYSSFGVSASCDISQIKHLLPSQSSDDFNSREIIKGFQTPYSFCSHMAMSLMGRLSNQEAGISYVFELGDEGQGGSKAYCDFLFSLGMPTILKRYGANSIGYAQKDSIHNLLQTADVLAWEWTKNIERKRSGFKPRPSLNALFGDDISQGRNKYGYSATSQSGNIICSHFQGENLNGFLEFFRKFMTDENVNSMDETIKDFNIWKETISAVSV